MLESKKEKRYWTSTSIVAWDRERLELEGKLAVSMIERWGTVAATPDGEDSAGRQKLRLSTPKELVMRACETAHLLLEEARKRGWIHITPSIQDEDEEKTDSPFPPPPPPSNTTTQRP